MGGVLAVLMLLSATAPASAGFRYVPPEEPEALRADEVGSAQGAADIEARPDTGTSVSATSVSGTRAFTPRVSGTGVWRVHAGETLRDALGRWGARAGTDVLFLTDRRYRLDGSAAFEGGFDDAARALFGALGHLPHRPVGAFAADGTSLTVTHRVPGDADMEEVR